MKNNHPILSVVITTHNRIKFLKQLINSILKQSYANVEIIVIDDNSNDGTDKFFHEKDIYRKINFIKRTENFGPSENRRLGFNLSKGSYIIFCDDDDYYTNYSFFSNAINILQRDESLAFVSGNANILNESINIETERKLNIYGKVDKSDYLNKFQFDYDKPFSTFSTIFSINHLKNVGFSKMNMINDASIYLKALLSGNAFIMQDVIGVYRLHGENISKNLDVDFILTNMEQKRILYIESKKRKIINNPRVPIFKTYLLTIKYYIKHNNINLTGLLKLNKYILMSAPNKLKLLFYLNKYYLLKLIFQK